MDYYGVIGNPISHTKSPLIHRLFAEQTQQPMCYEPIFVERHALVSALTDFQSRGGRGLNITSPFKQEAFACVTTASARAVRAQAVNVIGFNADGTCWGDNTDGVGLVRDITLNQQVDLRDKRLLIIGAGGAVRGVMEALLATHPRQVVIANRTESKAQLLAEAFADVGPIQACGLSDLQQSEFDVVINGTSASLRGEVLLLPTTIINQAGYCYDMVYGQGLTPLLSWAQKQGVRYSDGIGMLVEQAAESFYLWRGIRPDVSSVLEVLAVERGL